LLISDIIFPLIFNIEGIEAILSLSMIQRFAKEESAASPSRCFIASPALKNCRLSSANLSLVSGKVLTAFTLIGTFL
jgi:hypothetical protein